jgi:carbamoylphosphate synthase small subunit
MGPETAAMLATAHKLRTMIHEWQKPIFGIYMDHQIIGMAMGSYQVGY